MPRSDSSYTATSFGCSSTASSALTGLCLVLHASSLSSLEDSSSSCARSHTFSPPCAPTRESPELARSSTTSTDSEYATARLPSTDSYRSLSIPELSSAHGDVVSYATESPVRSSLTGSSVSASSYGTAHASSSASCHLENTHMIPRQDPVPEGADIIVGEANSQPPVATRTLSPAQDIAAVYAPQAVVSSPEPESPRQEGHMEPESLAPSPSLASPHALPTIAEHIPESPEAALSAQYTSGEQDGDSSLPATEFAPSLASPHLERATSPPVSQSPVSSLTSESPTGLYSPSPGSSPGRFPSPHAPDSSLSSISSVSSIDLSSSAERATASPPSAASRSLQTSPGPRAAPPEYIHWGVETDFSYESSALAASASSHSLPIPDGWNGSSDTSLLAPTGFSFSSPSTVPDVSGESRSLFASDVDVDTSRATLGTSSPSLLTSITTVSSVTPSFTSTACPQSARSSTQVSSPTSPSTPALSLSPEVTPPRSSLAGTLSTPTTASSSDITLSRSSTSQRRGIHSPASIVDMSSELSLLSTHASSVDGAPASLPTIPSLRSPSPRLAPRPHTPSKSPSSPRTRRSPPTPPTPSIRVSVSTPSGRVPSIASPLDTVASETPHARHGLEVVWARVREMEARRESEHAELVAGLQGVRSLVEELRTPRPWDGPARAGVALSGHGRPAVQREGTTSLRRVTQRITGDRGRGHMLQR